MLDLKNLSKVKHIYRIYETDDKVLHCEKYPVIYINSEVVYFKRGRKMTLDYTRTQDVHDDVTEFCNDNNYWKNAGYRLPRINKYFWNVETNILDIFENMKKQHDKMRRQIDAKNKIDRLERAKLEYEKALKAVEALNQ